MNGCAPGLALIERLKATRKWAITISMSDQFFDTPWCMITIYNFENRADYFCDALIHSWCGRKTFDAFQSETSIFKFLLCSVDVRGRGLRLARLKKS